MAFSQSVEKAQSLTVCQFCEESTEIKWKCINCELFLCELCSSKIHSKIKASMEHEIINLNKIGTDVFATSVRKVELENMVCTKHDNQRCFVFCQDCSQPACSKCLVETHKTHDYKALDEKYNEIISEMKELETTFESILQGFRNEKVKLQKMLSDGDNNLKETRKIILQTEKEMIKAISNHANELINKLESKWKPSENMIEINLSTVEKNEHELEIRMNNLHKALHSHQVADVFATRKILDTDLPKHLVTQIKPNKVMFIPSNMQLKIGSKMLGDRYVIPNIAIRDTYQSDHENVSNLRFCSDNITFIGGFKSQKLQKVKFENHNINMLDELQIQVFDMANTKDEEIIVSSGDNVLTLYTKEGNSRTFKIFPQLKTSSIHVTKDCKIIVGLMDSFSLPTTKDSIRRLVVMNLESYIQETIECNSDNQRLLNHPYRINTFSDKIVVVDVVNKEQEGRVVMLDYWGQLNWSYDGGNSINSHQVKFSPKHVAITSAGMILVSDCNNHAIHVLNHAGEVIVCKEVKSLGIALPCSLEFDRREVLWIGCDTPTKDKIKKAKIHCVELTYL